MFDKSKSIFFQPLDSPKQHVEAPEALDEKEINDVATKEYRYRVEQSILLKLDGRITTHGSTKQEYLIAKHIHPDRLLVEVKLVENVIKFDPPQLDMAVNLICSFDKVKADILLEIDTNGQLKGIADKTQVLKNWEEFKKETEETYAFVKSKEAAAHIEAFIDHGDQQVQEDELLLADFKSKLFFDILLDQYLVSAIYNDIFDKSMQSNLFDGYPLLLKGASLITHETEEQTCYKRSGNVASDGYSSSQLKSIYDERYKPLVGYSFTAYEYLFRQDLRIDSNNHVLLSATTEINERVKNNVEIVVNHEINLVEL